MFRTLFQNIQELIPTNGAAFQHILVSLKTRNFRLYFGGMCVSLIGTWMQQIAMSWLVYELTGSVLLLATVTFMAQIPILVVTPFVSVFVDRFDRRKILYFTQTLSMIQALLMAVLTLTGLITVWQIMLLSLLIGCINALDNPTRQAFYPSLVPKDHLSNAIALNSTVINGSRLIGPAIGGVLIGMFGEGICFLINGISYAGVIIALMRMKLAPFKSRRVQQHVLTDLSEGFAYVAASIPIRTLLSIMCVVSFFGLPLMTFIPAYVKDMLHGESEMLGLMLSCIGCGSFAAAVMLAARRSVLGLGKIVTIASILLGICLVSISFVTIPWIAAVLCVPIGFAIITTVASINTLLQTLSDEDKRGRVMGYLAMTFTGVSPIGSITLGMVVDSIGLPLVILLSGICCIGGAVLFERYRPIVRKHARPIYVRKGIIKEIAIGIDNSENQQF